MIGSVRRDTNTICDSMTVVTRPHRPIGVRCYLGMGSCDWPTDIRRFLDSVKWVFAKTYAKTWPHHYIVKERVDKALFERAVAHIREHGYVGRFYHTSIIYFEDDGMVYWTMVPPRDDPAWYPVEEETIINRCPLESTYEYRLQHGGLP